MKKTAITLLLIGMAVCAEAQTMYDALRFSENNYEGTARTMAMGNAFTALGGDLGSISINPAGSAVARYSQVTITPGVAISVNTSAGTSPDYFQRKYRTPMGRFSMPNIGFTINFDTYRSSGIKNWTLGFVVNRTNTYNDDLYARGLNSNTTFAGAMASFAQGIDVNDLVLTDSYDPYYDSSIPFDVILAYEAGIIDPLGGQDPDTGAEFTLPYDYAGVTENYYLSKEEDGSYRIDAIGLDGNTVEQVYSRRILGSKYDYVFNLGMNISDVVYFGANLGITSLTYSNEYYIREMSGGDASDYGAFQTKFRSLRYNNTYNVTGAGVYGKFGIIVTPWKGLRLGAAIQTPTAMSIRESYMTTAGVNTYSEMGNLEAETPDSKYDYDLTSPFRFNLGAAITLGNSLIISADYEMADYSRMKFHEAGTNDNTGFEPLNDDIRTLMGTSNMFRAGIEFKPVSSLAIRAGYGLTTSPERYYDSDDILRKAKANTNRFSCGLGYSSSGSFFADLAFHATRYQNEYIYPYDYYVIDGDNAIVDYSVDTPEILSKRWLFNVALTFGFRF